MSARGEEPPSQLTEDARDHHHGQPTNTKTSESPEFSDEKRKSALPPSTSNVEVVHLDEDDRDTASTTKRSAVYARYRPFILGGFAAVILGWWISATILPATRHRWYAYIVHTFGIFGVKTDTR
jgi:hypothetical protein